MIECIVSIDYEIFGNGKGSLRKLVYEPAQQLRAVFHKRNQRFVVFVEIAELEMIAAAGADPDAGLVRQQLREFHEQGVELGLHLHPWWYNARFENGAWLLDAGEYNLCTLPRTRIAQILDRSLGYFREMLGRADFTPFSYRAGHLLFQPARTVAEELAARGIKVDSSLYKGGLWHQHKLDYRPALKNGSYWRFTDCTNVADPQGSLLELPVHTRMVPTWKMFTTKRISQQQGASTVVQTGKKLACRLKDVLRLRYPMKFDLCNLTLSELTDMMDEVIREDREDPASFRPVIAIGHTKDFVDPGRVEKLLSYLERKGIRLTTFKEAYDKCAC